MCYSILVNVWSTPDSKNVFIHCGPQPYLHPRQQADDTAINVVFYLQVERQVVTQLAAAHERQLIHRGCALKLTVDSSRAEQQLRKDTDRTQDTQDAGRSQEQDTPAGIKLQILREGRKNEYVDVPLTEPDQNFGL